MNPKEHAGWFWIEEEAVRIISRQSDSPEVFRRRLLAYVTGCRVANLKGSQTFQKPLRDWATDMGLCYNHAALALADLERLGLVTIERKTVDGRKERAPSFYTVNRLFPDGVTSPTDGATSPTGCATLHRTSGMPSSAENSQEPPQEQSQTLHKERRTRQTPSKGPLCTLDEAKAYALDIGLPVEEGEEFFDYQERAGWVYGKQRYPIKSWRAALRTWKRNYKAPFPAQRGYQAKELCPPEWSNT